MVKRWQILDWWWHKPAQWYSPQQKNIFHRKRHTFDLISHGKRARRNERTSIIKRPADAHSGMHLPFSSCFIVLFFIYRSEVSENIEIQTHVHTCTYSRSRFVLPQQTGKGKREKRRDWSPWMWWTEERIHASDSSGLHNKCDNCNREKRNRF